MMNTTNRPIITTDTLKTICQGALGAMTFGAYHQFNTNKMMEIHQSNTNKMMELNNRHCEKIMELNNKHYEKEINELKEQHRLDNQKINELFDKFNKLEKQ